MAKDKSIIKVTIPHSAAPRASAKTRRKWAKILERSFNERAEHISNDVVRGLSSAILYGD